MVLPSVFSGASGGRLLPGPWVFSSLDNDVQPRPKGGLFAPTNDSQVWFSEKWLDHPGGCFEWLRRRCETELSIRLMHSDSRKLFFCGKLSGLVKTAEWANRSKSSDRRTRSRFLREDATVEWAKSSHSPASPNHSGNALVVTRYLGPVGSMTCRGTTLSAHLAILMTRPIIDQ